MMSWRWICLSSLLELLGSANGGSGDLAPLLALVGGSDSSLIEGIISNVIQQQIDSVLSELDVSFNTWWIKCSFCSG